MFVHRKASVRLYTISSLVTTHFHIAEHWILHPDRRATKATINSPSSIRAGVVPFAYAGLDPRLNLPFAPDTRPDGARRETGRVERRQTAPMNSHHLVNR